MNLLLNWANVAIGSSYGNNDLKQCLNAPELKVSKNILIGTSVSREVNLSPNNLNIMGEKYFVCGVSAAITNLDFHYLIIDLINQKYGINNKKILIEFSTQGALKSDSILSSNRFSNFLTAATLQSKIFWLNILFKKSGNYNKEIIINFGKTIYSFLFPYENFKNISLIPPELKRKNRYINKKSIEPQLIDKKQLNQYRYIFDKNITQIRLNNILELIQYNKGHVSFYLPPSNKFCTKLIPLESANNLNDFFKNLTNNYEVIDLRFLNNSNFFYDCAHLNREGQSVLEKHFLEGNFGKPNNI